MIALVVLALRDEAAQHGDDAQVEICDRALDGDETALAECARVISEAAARSGRKFRIITLSGPGLPTTVDADGYDTELAAREMAYEEHRGEWRVEEYEG